MPPSEQLSAHPYKHDDGSPRLRDSWVLYLDGLGTKVRAKNLTDADLLRRLGPEGWFHRYLYHANLKSSRRALYFTDNAVIGCPADSKEKDPLIVLNELLLGAATYIVGLAIEAGIAFRGAVTYGPLYIDDQVVADEVKLAAVQAAHGAALVEAVEFEERFAVFPRVVVAPSAVQKVRDLAAGSDALLRSEPERDWLIDNDGTVFLNHLKDVLAFDPNPDLKLRREEVMARYRNS